MEIDYERLAELLADRLAPALPSSVSLVSVGDTLVASSFPPTLTLMRLDYRELGHVPDRWESLMDAIANALDQIEDEASEATADRYESDFAVEEEQLRIWFGLVPPGTMETAWRHVLPELVSIPLEEFTTPPTAA